MSRPYLTDEIEVLRSLLRERLRKAADRNEEKFGFKYTDIDLEYMVEVYKRQKGLCVYTGEKLFVASKRAIWKKKLGYKPNMLSIDRIDPNKPYQKGNIQFVTARFNKIKQDLSNAELFRLFCLVFKNMFRYYGILGRILTVK